MLIADYGNCFTSAGGRSHDRQAKSLRPNSLGDNLLYDGPIKLHMTLNPHNLVASDRMHSKAGKTIHETILPIFITCRKKRSHLPLRNCFPKSDFDLR